MGERQITTAVSSPALERLIRVAVAGLAYLLAAETITDVAQPWDRLIREAGIAVALAPAAYVVHVLAQLTGGALGRLYLFAVTIGVGGLVRLVTVADREVVLRRWPVWVGLGWAADGRGVRWRLWLPSALPVAVFATAALWLRLRGYADRADVDVWRSMGGVAAAALMLAVVPWPQGPDRGAGTAAMLWSLPRLPVERVRAAYRPYVDRRWRAPLRAFARAAYRHDAEAVQRATDELAAAGAPADVVRRCRAMEYGLRGAFVPGAREVIANLQDPVVANAFDLSQFFAHVLAAREAGQDIPEDFVYLIQGYVPSLSRLIGRDAFAEKYALLVLGDGNLPEAEAWARRAIRWATHDIVEGDAQLTLARVRHGQGRPDEAVRALDRARQIHPVCPRWPAVERLVARAVARPQ